MTATELSTDADFYFDWSVDEGYALFKLKHKASQLIDRIRGAFLSQEAEEALHDLEQFIAEDNDRKTRVSDDAGYPSGPDEEF